MKASTISKGLRWAAGVGVVALTLAGCSSSVPGESTEETTEETTVVTEETTQETTEDPDTSDEAGQNSSDNALKDYQLEGQPAFWQEVELSNGDRVEALVPGIDRSGGGSVVFKNTSDIANISFVADFDKTTSSSPVTMVKLITQDSHKPQIVEIQPGSPQTLSLYDFNSDIIKIVWEVKGKPSADAQIIFHDFMIEKR